jgi:hypothetical protein
LIKNRHHGYLRQGATSQVFGKVIGPSIGKKIPEQTIKDGEKLLNFSLKLLNNHFLSSGNFLCGRNSPSIADLFAYEEISQLFVMNYDFSSYDNITKWINEMKNIQQYEKVHKVLHIMIKNLNKKSNL